MRASAAIIYAKAVATAASKAARVRAAARRRDERQLFDCARHHQLWRTALRVIAAIVSY